MPIRYAVLAPLQNLWFSLKPRCCFVVVFFSFSRARLSSRTLGSHLFSSAFTSTPDEIKTEGYLMGKRHRARVVTRSSLHTIRGKPMMHAVQWGYSIVTFFLSKQHPISECPYNPPAEGVRTGEPDNATEATSIAHRRGNPSAHGHKVQASALQAAYATFDRPQKLDSND